MDLKKIQLKYAHIGTRIKFPPWENVWEVFQVVDRGVLVKLVNAGNVGAHQHLETWEDLEKAIEA